MFLLLGNPKRLRRNPLKHSITAAALLCTAGAVATVAAAQDSADDRANHAWQSGAVAHAQRMRAFFDRSSDQQTTPPVIPSFETDTDPSGSIATTQQGGATQTSQNAFFANLGTNNRTCFTCHQPQTGWTVSAASVQSRFNAGQGTDPIFRLVDGATCPSDDISSVDAKLRAYSLLLSKGLIRIGLQVPTTIPGTTVPTEYRIVSVSDPYGCNTNPVTGLTNFGPDGPTTGIVSVYRRPLPSTNLGFLTTIMWDGREPSLASQSVDATRIHAQANSDPTAAQQQQVVNFESGIFTAQSLDNNAQNLKARGATGGPDALASLLPGFYVGINDPLGGNPKKLPFTSQIFDLFQAWNSINGGGPVNAARQSVARGEALPDVGNHSVKLPINIGIANGGPNNDNPVLDIADLPTFTLSCVSGPNAPNTYVVTDPGRALISGKCADIGKVKGPILRGLAGRAPYFHNGSAATLLDAVNFYDQRFNIGFTDAQKADLVAFLQTL